MTIKILKIIKSKIWLWISLFMALILLSCGEEPKTTQPVYSQNTSQNYPNYYQGYPSNTYSQNPYPQQWPYDYGSQNPYGNYYPNNNYYPYPSTSGYGQGQTSGFGCDYILAMLDRSQTYAECSQWATLATSQLCRQWIMDPCQNK